MPPRGRSLWGVPPGLPPARVFLGGAVRRRTYDLVTVALVVAGIVGVGMALYPVIADWWNNIHQSQLIADYDQAVSNLDPQQNEEVFAAAEAYNARLAKSGVLWRMTEEEAREYNSLLDVAGTGLMGYVDIPKIDVTLPIYHGTSNDVLVSAIGHIAGTSLPVGGVGTHCSVSGHRGLANARLLSDVGMLGVGDTFTVTVLDRVLTYEVDQIRTVLPTELDDLVIDPQQDYVTLVTCTPYGVNSHRLLIRGHRVDNLPGTVKVLADAVQVRPYLVAVALAVPAVVLFGVSVFLGTERDLRYQRRWKAAREGLRERMRRRSDE